MGSRKLFGSFWLRPNVHPTTERLGPPKRHVPLLPLESRPLVDAIISLSVCRIVEVSGEDDTDKFCKTSLKL